MSMGASDWKRQKANEVLNVLLHSLELMEEGINLEAGKGSIR